MGDFGVIFGVIFGLDFGNRFGVETESAACSRGVSGCGCGWVDEWEGEWVSGLV